MVSEEPKYYGSECVWGVEGGPGHPWPQGRSMCPGVQGLIDQGRDEAGEKESQGRETWGERDKALSVPALPWAEVSPFAFCLSVDVLPSPIFSDFAGGSLPLGLFGSNR